MPADRRKQDALNAGSFDENQVKLFDYVDGNALNFERQRSDPH
jgi:hypothetical protein